MAKSNNERQNTSMKNKLMTYAVLAASLMMAATPIAAAIIDGPVEPEFPVAPPVPGVPQLPWYCSVVYWFCS